MSEQNIKLKSDYFRIEIGLLSNAPPGELKAKIRLF